MSNSIHPYTLHTKNSMKSPSAINVISKPYTETISTLPQMDTYADSFGERNWSTNTMLCTHTLLTYVTGVYIACGDQQ